ncbi:MAG TPA: two pore domain potassium channel family protein [Actinobacteria bacterium]|nr:two pore domain potassium channel family protein [Actinomycetota bacterium]
MDAEDRHAEDDRWDRSGGRVLMAAAFGILGIGTVAYHYLEGWGWIDALYFSTVALTTVGFGDLAPTKPITKLFTVGYLLTGIAIIGLYLDHRLRRARYRRARRHRK